MRKYTVPVEMKVEYLLGDHLGSTSITTDQEGTKVSEIRYKPWGEIRSSWTLAQSTTPAYSLTDYTFTGQFSYMDDPSTTAVTEGFGLMFYNARFYDPALGRFISADSIIPGGVQGLDRYAYVSNSPINYTDPSGHEKIQEGEQQDKNKPSVYNQYVPKPTPPRPESESGPICTVPPTSTANKPETNPASSYPVANSYYWSSLAYGESAYLAFTRLSPAKNGINYGLSGNNTFGLNGRYYTPGTINRTITNSFTGLNAFGFSFATAAIGNVIDYGWGANADKGYGQDFAVSTAVDTVLTYTVGAAAAVGVGLVLGASAAPLAVIGLTAVVATGAMLALDSAGVPDMLKQNTNDFIDYVQGG